MTGRRFLGFRPEGVIAPFVSDDMYKALRAEGHDVLVIDVREIREEFDVRGMAVWDDWIARIKEFAPEAALFYGTCGVVVFSDRHEDGGHLLDDLNIPIAPCFFDDPNYVLGVQASLELPKETLCFVWDRFHLSKMAERGFINLSFLPLGTDETVFKPMRQTSTKFTHPLSFTGSLGDSAKFIETVAGADDALKLIFEKAIRRRLEEPSKPFHIILEELSQRLEEGDWTRWKNFSKRPDFWNFHNTLNQVTNVIWREQIVTSIAMNNISVAVYGNDTWKAHGDVDYRGGINYHRALPKLYASTPLHLNLTAPQLADSINNRVYDVLASGSMVLTDWREELARGFDPDEDLIVFRSVEEAVEQALRWVNRDDELRKRAESGRRKVLENHTWRHRMREAVSVIEERLL